MSPEMAHGSLELMSHLSCPVGWDGLVLPQGQGIGVGRQRSQMSQLLLGSSASCVLESSVWVGALIRKVTWMVCFAKFSVDILLRKMLF